MLWMKDEGKVVWERGRYPEMAGFIYTEFHEHPVRFHEGSPRARAHA